MERVHLRRAKSHPPPRPLPESFLPRGPNQWCTQDWALLIGRSLGTYVPPSLSEKAFLEQNSEIKKVLKINKHTHMEPEGLARSRRKARDDAGDAGPSEKVPSVFPTQPLTAHPRKTPTTYHLKGTTRPPPPGSESKDHRQMTS